VRFSHLIHLLLHRFGFAILRYNMDNFVCLRRTQILLSQSIDVVLDVGAHDGSYGKEIRVSGFGGRIISFEPLREAFTVLEKRCRQDASWECVNKALGDSDGESIINISGRKTSSSLLEMSDRHMQAEPGSSCICREKINISKLDSLLCDFSLHDKRMYLKIDVQGYERKVLDGATLALEYIKAVELELSMVKLYEGGPLYYEMIEYLRSRGFDLISTTGGFSDHGTGHLLQADGIFVRRTG
jgi:FkbM family methyltransferase